MLFTNRSWKSWNLSRMIQKNTSDCDQLASRNWLNSARNVTLAIRSLWERGGNRESRRAARRSRPQTDCKLWPLLWSELMNRASKSKVLSRALSSAHYAFAGLYVWRNSYWCLPISESLAVNNWGAAKSSGMHPIQQANLQGQWIGLTDPWVASEFGVC